MENLAPPPYSPDLDPSPRTPSPSDAAVPLQLNTADLSGIREIILDNAPTLFTLAHGYYKSPPGEFRICTCREPAQLNGRVRAGEVHAAVYIATEDKNHFTELGLFVQGPQAPTTEAALKALLDKMEVMIGKRRRKFKFEMKNYLEA